jgi:hypothetical protein
MKYMYIIGISVLAFFASMVYAHVGGQSYFKINSLLTYPSSTTSTSNNEDIAPAFYEPGKNINFELDTSYLSIPQYILDKALFTWDFGDGTPPQAVTSKLKNKHIYTKVGEYRLTITVDIRPAGFFETPPQVVETVKIPVAKPVSAEEIIIPKKNNATTSSQQATSSGTTTLYEASTTLQASTTNSIDEVSKRGIIIIAVLTVVIVGTVTLLRKGNLFT